MVDIEGQQHVVHKHFPDKTFRKPWSWRMNEEHLTIVHLQVAGDMRHNAPDHKGEEDNEEIEEYE